MWTTRPRAASGGVGSREVVRISVAPAGHGRLQGGGPLHSGALGYVCFFVGCYVAFCFVDETLLPR